MEIIPCGTKARPKSENLEAIVTAVSIRFCRITYELSYFYNGDYKTVWLDECEFDVEKEQRLRIGFKVA